MSKQTAAVVTTAIVTTFIIHAFWQRAREWKLVSRAPPGRLGYWWLGETLALVRSSNDYYMDRMKRNGLNFLSHVLFAPTVVLGRLEDIKVFEKHERVGNTVVGWPDSMKNLTGPHALSSVMGDAHRRLRLFIGKSLSPKVVAGYIPIIDEMISKDIKSWPRNKLLNSLDFKKLTLETFFKSVFGDQFQPADLEELSVELEYWYQGLKSVIPFPLPGTALHRAMQSRTNMFSVFRRVMDRYRDTTEVDEKNPRFTFPPHTMLANLYHQANLTMDEILDNILVIAVGGHDSACYTMGSTIALLFDPKHASILNKLREEVQAAFPTLEALTPEDGQRLRELPYLNACMLEMLRLCNPLSMGIRTTKVSIELSDGYVVDKGVNVGTGITVVHRNPDLFGDDVNEYRPERFLDPETGQQTLNNFKAFGGGPRECVGQEFARVELRIFILRICQLPIVIRKKEYTSFPFTGIVPHFECLEA